MKYDKENGLTIFIERNYSLEEWFILQKHNNFMI